jgi:uncharacterized UBP type Zn finger protein
MENLESNFENVNLTRPCSHVKGDIIRKIERPQAACEDCIIEGSQWVHLRVCLNCGHVGCCDQSPRQHATRHFIETKHPLITSAEEGEDWAFCYDHNQVLSI